MSLLFLPYDTLNIECHAGRSIYTKAQLHLNQSINIPQPQYEQFRYSPSICQSIIELDFLLICLQLESKKRKRNAQDNLT